MLKNLRILEYSDADQEAMKFYIWEVYKIQGNFLIICYQHLKPSCI